MKSLWFYTRILLDILGALALVFLLFVAYLIADYHFSERDHDQMESDPPVDHSQLLNIGLPNASQWQLVGDWSQQRCAHSPEQYLVQFRHMQSATGFRPEGDAWQRIDASGGQYQTLLKLLKESPCRQRLNELALSDADSLWLRLQDLQWWDGELRRWTLYIYDSRRNTVLIWRNALPY